MRPATGNWTSHRSWLVSVAGVTRDPWNLVFEPVRPKNPPAARIFIKSRIYTSGPKIRAAKLALSSLHDYQLHRMIYGTSGLALRQTKMLRHTSYWDTYVPTSY